MDFKRLTFKDYKDIGEKYLRENPFGTDKLPTDIEILITKSGFALDVKTALYKNFGIKGFVAKNIIVENKYKIYIDQEHYENQEFQCNFTLAEELAHIILHSNLYSDVKSLDDFIKSYNSFSDDNYKKYEQQARCLASRLLLPQNKFEEYVLNWVEDNLKKIRKAEIFSKDEFASLLARPISKKLSLTENVISISLMRYPDTIIDIILDKFGMSLIK